MGLCHSLLLKEHQLSSALAHTNLFLSVKAKEEVMKLMQSEIRLIDMLLSG